MVSGPFLYIPFLVDDGVIACFHFPTVIYLSAQHGSIFFSYLLLLLVYCGRLVQMQE